MRGKKIIKHGFKGNLKSEVWGLTPRWSFLRRQKSCKALLPWRSSLGSCGPGPPDGQRWAVFPPCRLWASVQRPARSASSLLLTKPTDGWAMKEVKRKDVGSEGSPGRHRGNGHAANAGDAGLIPGSERSPGGGHGNPPQCSCLENPMDRGAWRATDHGVSKSWTQLSD